ncbi:MAG: hypothetical protein JRH20_31660 [Deltaproteobacteria bacterium]|nr:hypothetical protein [Deltaproteobacteria bacterium]
MLSTAQTWPLIESQSLVACGHEKRALAVQLSRWVSQGRLMRLRRGLYMLCEPYQRVSPSREYVANFLRRPSFISFESALAFHNIIPEGTPLLRSVTTSRPGLFSIELGEFDYRHVAASRFFGYRECSMASGSALIATPERALLDLLYFMKGLIDEARIRELRLQNLEDLDLNMLQSQALRYESPRLASGAALLRAVVEREQQELETL